MNRRRINNAFEWRLAQHDADRSGNLMYDFVPRGTLGNPIAPGVVYVVRMNVGTKIGVTTVNVKQRVSRLRHRILAKHGSFDLLECKLLCTVQACVLERRIQSEFRWSKTNRRIQADEVYYLDDDHHKWIAGIASINGFAVHQFNRVEEAEIWLAAVRCYPV